MHPLIVPIISIAAWLGIDIGLDMLSPGDTVPEPDPLTAMDFIGLHWPTLILYMLFLLLAVRIAFPNNGCGPRRKDREPPP